MDYYPIILVLYIMVLVGGNLLFCFAILCFDHGSSVILPSLIQHPVCRRKMYAIFLSNNFTNICLVGTLGLRIYIVITDPLEPLLTPT